MIVRAAPPRDFAWLYQRTGFLLSGTGRAIEAVDSRDRIHGMVGYDDWTPASVRMHVAVDAPAAVRPLLRPAFLYPFAEVGVEVALIQVVSAHHRVVELARHLGFRETHRLAGGWAPGADLVWMELHRRDCRFLSQRKAVR